MGIMQMVYTSSDVYTAHLSFPRPPHPRGPTPHSRLEHSYVSRRHPSLSSVRAPSLSIAAADDER